MTKRLENFTADLKTYLASYFEKAGFALHNEHITFQHRTESYTDYIVLYAGEDTHRKSFSTMITAYRRVEVIEQYWEEYKVDPLGITQSIPYTFAANMNEKDPRTNQQVNVSRQVLPMEGYSIAEICDKHIAFWEDRFKPWFDRYTDIATLNKEVNATVEATNFPLHNFGTWFYKMIIARLAGDAKLDAITAHLTGIYQRGLEEEKNELDRAFCQHRLQVTEALYQKLKNTQPLPGLSS